MAPRLHSHQRQVHLDFHTSPFIPDVAHDFDAAEFAATFRRAHVNSVTVFAKCHHGQSYYPTKVGTMHPALRGRDLLGEQIEALHREGIRAPIYTTVAWEEHLVHLHPDWRMLRRDGTFARVGHPHPSSPPGQAPWYFLNFLHPAYQDHIEAHLRELIARYGKAVDGFFLDIVFFEEQSCWSDASRRFRDRHRLNGTDRATQVRFETLGQESFERRISRLVRGLAPGATLFFNGTRAPFADARLGMRRRHPHQTHWEIESLPSGFWGYHHFPRMARALPAWGKPWLGMTGRFQKMWGDFGGLKPPAALEYECFRSQALGGGNSIGDQLPPRGRLDAGAYDLIGAVYAQCAGAESFYRGSVPLPEIGIAATASGDNDPNAADKALEGAVQMCEEAHYDAVVIDDASDLSRLRLIILPDLVEITPRLAAKLQRFMREGGKLILSHRSGFAPGESRCRVPGLALRWAGTTPSFPTYWRSSEGFDAKLARSERVIYSAGAEIEIGRGLRVLARRVPPYFQRSEAKFCSHFQAPPARRPSRFPAILEGSGFIYFADPIFSEYRQSGNTAARDGWRSAMARLIGPPRFGSGLPTTVLCVPRRRGRDLIVTLLHYIPTRKALDIDIIEERSSFAGERLLMRTRPTRPRLFGAQTPLEIDADGALVLPPGKGRLLIECRGYFA